jgi:hypothetical protein
MTVSGTQGFQPVWIPPFARLPQSVTSLTINTDIATILEIRDVIQQLPNLDDLKLLGSPFTIFKDRLRGICTVLRGRFGGELRLNRLKRDADRDAMDMLLEVPTGLHFSEVHILSVHECLLSTVRVTEACGKNLVRLTYSIDFYGECSLAGRCRR